MGDVVGEVKGDFPCVRRYRRHIIWAKAEFIKRPWPTLLFIFQQYRHNNKLHPTFIPHSSAQDANRWAFMQDRMPPHSATTERTDLERHGQCTENFQTVRAPRLSPRRFSSKPPSPSSLDIYTFHPMSDRERRLDGGVAQAATPSSRCEQAGLPKPPSRQSRRGSPFRADTLGGCSILSVPNTLRYLQIQVASEG